MKPEPSAIVYRMDAVAYRHSVISATAQIGRQSVFVLTNTAWENTCSVFATRKLKVMPLPPRGGGGCPTPMYHFLLFAGLRQGRRVYRTTTHPPLASNTIQTPIRNKSYS